MNKINFGFTNTYGKYYPNIRDIHFESLNELNSNLGVMVAETKHDDPYCSTWDTEKLKEGVYIYRSKYDKNIALRLYKDYMDYKYISYRDDKLISRLQEKQKDIKLTEFPTGIISLEGKVVGQEIPFYDGYDTINSIFKENKLNVLPTHIYIEVLKILKELYNAGILYKDIHGKNFLINQNNDIKLIDFEDRYISFDEDMKYSFKSVLGYLKDLLKRLDSLSDIKISQQYEKCDTFDQIYDVMLEENYQLIKKLNQK